MGDCRGIENGWLSGCCLLVLRIPTASYRFISREWKKENVLQLHFHQLLVLAGRSPLEQGSWVGGVGDRTGWATVEEKANEVWPTSVSALPPLRPEGRNTMGNPEDWVWELPHPENWTDPSSLLSLYLPFPNQKGKTRVSQFPPFQSNMPKQLRISQGLLSFKNLFYSWPSRVSPTNFRALGLGVMHTGVLLTWSFHQVESWI